MYILSYVDRCNSITFEINNSIHKLLRRIEKNMM